MCFHLLHRRKENRLSNLLSGSKNLLWRIFRSYVPINPNELAQPVIGIPWRKDYLDPGRWCSRQSVWNWAPIHSKCMCVNIKVFLNEFQYFPVFLYIFQMWLTQVVWSIVWSLETVAFLWQPVQPKTDGQCWSSIFWKIIWFSIKLIQKTIPSNPKQSIMKK